MATSEKASSIVLPKRPFLRGIARLFDFSGELDRELIEQMRARYQKRPPSESGEDSLRTAWGAVGYSLRRAIGEYENETGLAGSGRERQSDAESIRNARQEDLMVLMGLVDADEKRVKAIWRSVDERWQRALDSYHQLTNGK